MLIVESLTKQFGPTTVLNNISFQAKKGEILGFLGPNGAGKTTTMRIITGFLAPSSGTIRYGELDINRHLLELRQKIGYLPESNPLYTELLVYETLEFVADTKGVTRWDQAYRQVIQICGLKEVLTKPIGELSKGYRQRVGLAQAMLGDPEILIMDEPTSGLDPNQIKEVREVIKRIGQTKTIIFSTHILSEVQAICNRVIIIGNGQIIAQGTVDELISRQGSGERISLLLEGPYNDIQAAISTLAPAVTVTDHRSEEGANRLVVTGGKDLDLRRRLFQLCKQRQWTLLEMTREQRNLEDVFHQLTQGKKHQL